jgi:hypothetical protein
MRVSDTGSAPLSLNIGHLGLTLVCEEDWLYKLIVDRYSGYLVNHRYDKQIVIDRAVCSSDRLSFPEEVEFRNDVLEVKSPTCIGQLDLKRGDGHLVVGDEQTIQSIDYYLRVVFSVMGYMAGGFLFHGAGIARSEGVHVFFGYSGSGKSTIAKFSSSELILSDDLVLIMPKDNGWHVCSTPFWNQTDPHMPPSENKLIALYRLVKAKSVFLEPLNQGEAVAEMIASIPIITLAPKFINQLITRCLGVYSSTPCYRLHFRRDGTFWKVIDELHG